MSTRRLALAGVVAPPLFAAIVLLLTLLDWDELHDLGWSAGPFDDPDATWPSVAMLADQGFLQSLNCTMLGVATIGLAVALRRLGARLVESALVGIVMAALMVPVVLLVVPLRESGPGRWRLQPATVLEKPS